MTNEHLVVPGRRLGRLAPKNAPALMLADILRTIPTTPPAADYLTEVADFCMCDNDKFGDCGPVSVANSLKAITKIATGTEVSVTVDDVLALYKLVNPDFDPATGAGDNGVDMQTMLELLLKHGIGGHVPVAFAKVNTDLPEQELRAAVAYFGCVLIGVDLDTVQQTQTDRGGPWDYAPSAAWGGHAVAAGKFTSDSALHHTDVSVVTWGEIMGTTDTFLSHQLGEAWVVIWPEHLTHPAFLAGVDLNKLALAFQAITGKTLPIPAPNPTPLPVPDPGAAPFPGADPAVAAEIVRRATRRGQTPTQWMNHHFDVVFWG